MKTESRNPGMTCSPKLLRATVLSFGLFVTSVPAADLVLLSDGKSDYQIVIPDELETPALSEGLAQTARLLQTAFQANGAEVPVVAY